MLFAFRKNGSVESLQCLALETYDFIRHAFCTRRTGVSKVPFLSLNAGDHLGDREEDVLKNRAMIADAFHLDSRNLIIVDQVHGDGILVLGDPADSTGKYASAACDAIVTDRPGLALAVKTADCVPIFLVDPVRRIVGAVHAGWRGTTLKIAAKTVDVFIKRFAGRPGDILAVIGPAIGPCCYEVDEQVHEAMMYDKNRDRLFRPLPDAGKWMFDLPLANKLHILNRGVPEENIFLADCCTACRKDMFFSHRAEGGKTGRQLNFIYIKNSCNKNYLTR
ncbi:MAG: peptidoglycan editing factor PgeF [Deltaproteobacteria bacterium]|nr:peptidoglycan editing factor PgeF [Deltaproteobacteria bacterium]